MNPLETKKKQNILTQAHNDFSKGLNAYAFFKVHNSATSLDLVQDTFIKTWKYIVRGGDIRMMKAFLFRILNNLIVDEYRKRKSESLDALLEKNFEPADDNLENIFNVMDGKTAMSLIEKLPKKYKETLSMRYARHLTIKEISLITGQSKNAIAVQSHRGLIKLKDIYNPKKS